MILKHAIAQARRIAARTQAEVFIFTEGPDEYDTATEDQLWFFLGQEPAAVVMPDGEVETD